MSEETRPADEAEVEAHGFGPPGAETPGTESPGVEMTDSDEPDVEAHGFGPPGAEILVETPGTE